MLATSNQGLDENPSHDGPARRGLYPQVFRVADHSNLSRPAERVVAFDYGRTTAEQWIKEVKNAAKCDRDPTDRAVAPRDGRATKPRAGSEPGAVSEKLYRASRKSPECPENFTTQATWGADLK